MYTAGQCHQTIQFLNLFHLQHFHCWTILQWSELSKTSKRFNDKQWQLQQPNTKVYLFIKRFPTSIYGQMHLTKSEQNSTKRIKNWHYFVIFKQRKCLWQAFCPMGENKPCQVSPLSVFFLEYLMAIDSRRESSLTILTLQPLSITLT